MLIYTAKLHRGRLMLGAVAAALLCAVTVAAVSWVGGNTAVLADRRPNPKGVKTAEERVAYLERFGWVVNPEPLSVEELLIPEELDERYDSYLELQTSQGFDLAKYRGKRVKRYTYEIQNYPTGEQGVQAAILLYKNTVVAGEVLSSQLNGFLHGLSFPDTPAA